MIHTEKRQSYSLSDMNGQSCSMADMFSGQRRIIVPDLQRDYCWGDIKPAGSNDTLAQSFLASLMEFFDDSGNRCDEVPLGLIYAYENPPNLVNIADGQQRLTTLYLLLCLLYRMVRTDKSKGGKGAIASFLALDSDKEVWEPRLLYQVRESTVYFMKDCLNHLCNHGNAWSVFKPGAKSEPPWFRHEYRHDPSVCSMVVALNDMNKALVKKMAEKQAWDADKFASFLLGFAPSTPTANAGISFIFFDMENREFGEKMYVVINTRGAPMEPNEHVKPLLLHNLPDSGDGQQGTRQMWAEKWEDWQDFFWQKRKKGEQSADDGFNDFLTWYVQIKEKDGEVDVYQYLLQQHNAEATLEELSRYFEQLEILWSYAKDKKFQQIFNQLYSEKDIDGIRDLQGSVQSNVILPLLAFMYKTPGKCEQHYQVFRRLRKFYFDVKWKRVTDAPREWQTLVGWISEADAHVNLLKRTEWHDDDERWKDSLRASHGQVITDIENHRAFGGRIDLIRELVQPPDGSEGISVDAVHRVIVDQNLFDQGNDLRRALLTYGNYFPHNGSLCCDSEWHLLVFHHKSEKRNVLRNLIRDAAQTQVAGGPGCEVKQFLKDRVANYLKELDWSDWRIPFLDEQQNVFEHSESQRADVTRVKIVARITKNPKKFTNSSKRYVSQKRRVLLTEICESLARESRDAKMYFLQKPDKSRYVVDKPKEEKSYRRFWLRHWLTVGIPILDGRALIAISCDGYHVEVGIRRGVGQRNLDNGLKTQIAEWVDKDKYPALNNEWWYCAREETLTLETNADNIAKEMAALQDEVIKNSEGDVGAASTTRQHDDPSA